MKGSEFYNQALLLFSGSSPVEMRSCTSRAYYGAFHCVYDFLKELGIRMPRTAECHDKLWKILAGSDDPEVRVVSSKLSSLRNARNAADYNLADPLPEKKRNVAMHIKEAHDIIECIRNCAVGGPKASTQASIRNYAQSIFRL